MNDTTGNTLSVLCICIHNSARSQMAEAYLNAFGRGTIRASSAGLEKGTLNPYVVDVMLEDGIDISGKGTQTVDEVHSRNEQYDVVITVCDDASRERCPCYLGKGTSLHWPFPDPSSFGGEPDEIRAKTRAVRDAIKGKVKEYVDSLL